MNSAARHARRTLWVGLGLGLLARLVFALRDDGLWWPDEYYQALEPAHRLVFGYGWQAWEFVEGARHWTLPGLVAGLMFAASAVHLPYLEVIELTCCLASVATAFGVYRLALALGARPLDAAIGALCFSVMGLTIFMAPRTMGEGLSALPLTFAFAWLVKPRSHAQLIGAGVLLCLAVGLRLQNGLFCVAALVMVGLRAPRDGAVLLGTLSLGALLYGWIDRLTWGDWFHSARVYLQFNLIEGKASDFGRQPLWHYVTSFFTADGLVLVPLWLLSLRAARRAPALPATMTLVFLVHSFIPHKELRFLFPLIPLLCAHAALGLAGLAPKFSRGLIAAAFLSGLTLPFLTFGRLGIVDPPRATPAMDFGGAWNRLLRRAGTLPVCGLRLVGFPHWRTGGYAYFHRAAPLYRAEKPDEGAGHFDYVIAPRGTVEGEEVAVDGEVALIHLVNTACTPDPAYDWRLE